MSLDISQLDNEGLLQLLEQLKYENKYHKLKRFYPYPYQKKFFDSGSTSRQRMLCAANRIGKTFSAAAEMSYHLTQDYPEWWAGKTFDKPILAWSVGITGESTQNVLQKELFGTSNARDADAIGSGSIPRHAIDMDLLRRDGARIVSAVIKGKNGDSTLQFKSTQQGQHVLMGATVDLILLDEEDKHNSMEIYSQCLTRVATTKGQVICTMTPENGLTELVAMYRDDESGHLYFQNATWSDAEHLSEEDKETILAGYPKWQRDMRSLGIPMLGSGLVFEFDPYEKRRKFEIMNTDRILWSLDIASANDATVLSLLVHKEDGHIYLAEQFCLTEDEDGNNIRKAHNVADIIKGNPTLGIQPHRYENAPLILPNDDKIDETGFGHILRTHGVNVQAEKAYNPAQVSSDWRMGTGHAKSVQVGIDNMVELFRLDRMWIDPSCFELLKEMTGYYVEPKTGGGIKFSHSDTVDSFRYGVISLLGNRGSPAGQCQKNIDDYNNGFDFNYEDHAPDYEAMRQELYA